jgi:membrane-bound lytic murein transglycosylase D
MRRFAPVFVVFSLACAGAPRTPAPGSISPIVIADSVPLPPMELLALTPEAGEPPRLLPGFPFGVAESDFDLPIAYNAHVQRFVDLLTGSARDRMSIWLTRRHRYEPMIEAHLREAGLPLTLKVLPLVESGYVPSAVSRASARGLWQFMTGTARMEGLEVSPRIDDRLDPEISTVGAARHLRRLRDYYGGSWYLALAAYNSGMGRVDRALIAAGVDRSLGDSAFWAIRDRLPTETRNYVPMFIASAVISRYPSLFGFEGQPSGPSGEIWDWVTVPDEAELSVIARILDVDSAVVRALNPRFVQGLTPAGREVEIRVPPGVGERFAAAWASLPADQRVNIRWHVVRRGETLSGIARRYGVPTAVLQRTNNINRPSSLQIGTRLRVPLRGGAVPAVQVAAAAEAASTPRVVTHRVRRGESVWTIARRYGVRAADVLAWNDLSEDSIIRPGDQIRIHR